jgi:flagellar basal-body rod protein FlgF
MNTTYLGLSAQLSLQRRLDSIAANVANAGTVGFRAEQIRYATARSNETAPAIGFASIGDTYLARKAGELAKTDNPLDVAVDGDAWLGITTPQGTAYTRDGRMQIGPAGELLTQTGHPVLDAGGAGIRLDPAAGPPNIASDGMITQDGKAVGAIGLFTIDPSARLERAADASVIPNMPAQPAVDQPTIGLRQGFVERSNVNPVVEMTRLIFDQRMFEAVSAALSENEQLRSESIRALGAAS